MVIGWLVLGAAATPVVCDPAEAARVLVDARIDERRAPVTHPTLVPGLALASPDLDDGLKAAIERVCSREQTSVERGDRHVDAGWSAHTVVLSGRERTGCMLEVERVALSIGVGVEGAPRYRLRSELPAEHTPVGDCDEVPRWRNEQVLAGADGRVRVVLVTDHEGDEVAHQQVVVRRATPDGWHQQTLIDPAPPRVSGGHDGPSISLSDLPGAPPWIVASMDRSGPECQPRPGQTVWTLTDDRWVAHQERDALHLLATRGDVARAGEDGWFLILAQDDAEDRALVEARSTRMSRRDDEPLYVWDSDDFPGLHPGFVFVAPSPWGTQAEAEAARGRWGRRRAAYVKRGWTAPDPCP